jgi:phosphate-selective porin OprO/OprP
MNSRTAWAGAAALWLPLSLAWAQAGTAPADDATLQQKIDEQEQRLKVLERRLEIQDEANAAATAANPVVKTGAKGFSIGTPDGANIIKFRANLAVDGRWFGDELPQTADTFLFRRARPYIEGTIGNIYDFRLMPDFAGGRTIILDAYINGKFKPWLNVQAGKFKGPVGLERLQPDQYNRFLELGFPSALVPNRDLGIQVAGEFGGGVLNYAVGYFNGTLDGSSTDANATPDVDNDGKKDIEARLFANPFANSANFFLRGLGFGIAGTHVNQVGTAAATLLPAFRTPGQQSFFSFRGNTTAASNDATFASGERERWSPQLYYYLGRVGLIGEYVSSSQEVRRNVVAGARADKLENTAWQASVSYFLTGEDAAYASFTPNTSFEIGKPGWGAWEVAVRYHELKIDDDAFVAGADSFANPLTQARRARAAGIGVNWYLNQNVKWMLDYERTRFDGGAATGDRPDEKALLTRFSLVF